MVRGMENLMVGVVNAPGVVPEVFVVGAGNVEVALKDRAKNVANYVNDLDSVVPGKADLAKTNMANMLQAINRRYTCVQDLFTDNSNNPRVEQAKLDWYDGIVLGTVFGANRGMSGGVMKEALKNGDAGVIDNLLAASSNGVLRGAGALIVEAQIRDQSLVRMIKRDQVRWNRVGELESLVERIRNADDAGTVNSTEAATAVSYFTAVIESREADAVAKAATEKAAEKAAEEARRRAEEARRRAQEIADKQAEADAAARAEKTRSDKMKLKYFQAMWSSPTPDSPQIGSVLAPEWQKELPNPIALSVVNLNNSAFMLDSAPAIEGWTDYLYRATDNVMNEFLGNSELGKGVRWVAKDMLQRYFVPVAGANGVDYFNLRFKGRWEGTGKAAVWKIDDQVKRDFSNLNELFEKYTGEMVARGLVYGNTPLEKKANAAMVMGVWGSLMRVSLLTDDANPSGSYDVSGFRNQVWNAVYPEAKGLQKFAFNKTPNEQSPFAGNFGEWLRMREESSRDPNSHTKKGDKEFLEQWVTHGTIHPLPERLLVNYFTTTKVKVSDGPHAGREVCMLRALYEGWTIKYEEMGKDSWIGFHDKVRATAGLFEYIGATGKESPIMFGKTSPADWVLGIEKKYVYLRGIPELQEVFRNTRTGSEDHSPWAERMMWMMGACAGGFADTPELVIMQGAENPPENFPQSRAVLAFMESDAMKKMLDQQDRDWIARRVNAFYDKKSKTPIMEHQKSLDKRKTILRRAIGKGYWGKYARIPVIG